MRYTVIWSTVLVEKYKNAVVPYYIDIEQVKKSDEIVRPFKFVFLLCS